MCVWVVGAGGKENKRIMNRLLYSCGSLSCFRDLKDVTYKH